MVTSGELTMDARPTTSENSFCLEAPAIPGCTNPDATNYNPWRLWTTVRALSTPRLHRPQCMQLQHGGHLKRWVVHYPDSFETSCGTCTYDCDGTCLATPMETAFVTPVSAPVARTSRRAITTPRPPILEPALSDPGFNCDGTSLCLEDLNGNGSIDVGDVLLVLSEFGCDVDCTADVTGDGFVTVDDVLTVLSLFGEDCN